jgi:hypothetical protein
MIDCNTEMADSLAFHQLAAGMDSLHHKDGQHIETKAANAPAEGPKGLRQFCTVEKT